MHNFYFKSIVAYTFSDEDKEMSFDKLSEKVPKLAHKEIKPYEKEAFGFSSITGYNIPEITDLFVHQADRFILLSMTHEVKSLNDKKCERMVALELKKVADKDDLAIKDLDSETVNEIRGKITKQLLADTEPSEDYVNVCIDTELRRLYVSDNSKIRVDRLFKLLQKVAPGMILTEFGVDTIEMYLTQWLYDPDQNLPEKFVLSDSATLKAEDDAQAVLTRQFLRSEEIKVLLAKEKLVRSLALEFLGRLEFKITDKYILKSVVMTDTLQTVAEENIDAVDRTTFDVYNSFWMVFWSDVTDLFDYLQEKCC